MRNLIGSVLVGILLFFLLAVLAVSVKDAISPATQDSQHLQPCPSQKVAPAEGGKIQETEIDNEEVDEYGRPRKKDRPERRRLFPRLFPKR